MLLSGAAGTWNREGVLFSLDAVKAPASSVYSQSGGPVTEATQLAPRQTSHRFPQFLSDGRRFLLARPGSWRRPGRLTHRIPRFARDKNA